MSGTYDQLCGKGDEIYIYRGVWIYQVAAAASSLQPLRRRRRNVLSSHWKLCKIDYNDCIWRRGQRPGPGPGPDQEPRPAQRKKEERELLPLLLLLLFL
ncbi:uncharacterized protein Dvir_GJ26308 [Drosophila virilis]|uniref:Uncharacterized protein n=1 Tax=Drosophila virilis TaxID=7244 RepID=A0A0Q9VZR4_DROVI|nr:uncharacterized protein Dvir_GJ26308 [Drosophila virilis]